MTYIVPNYFIENGYEKLQKIDTLFCLHYISRVKHQRISARNTMHSMNILLEGSKTIHLDDKETQISSSQICFLTQNNYFMSERASVDLKYKSLIIYFDDAFVLDFIKKYKVSTNCKEKCPILTLSYHNDALLNNGVHSLEEYLDLGLDENLIKLKIEELFLHVLRIKKASFLTLLGNMTLTSQHRTQYILESNVDIIRSVEEMSQLTRLSQDSLRTYFKKNYQQTPKVWLDNKRLEKALLLLKDQDKSISEISHECGYASTSWFISQFKKKHHLTPQEFRHNI